MAKIKGITIEIDGNTQGLEKALKGVEKNTTSIQKELKQVDKLLKFDPNNTVLLSQKQELLGKSISSTSEKLKVLKSVEEQVEAQFKQGKIGEEQYRAFKRELESTQNVLEGYKGKLSGIQSEQSKLGENTKTLEKYFSLTGKSVEDFRHVLGDKLTNAIKSGKASSADLDKALEKIGKSALGSKVDVNEFKNAINKIDGSSGIDKLEKQFKSLDGVVEESTKKIGKKLDFQNIQAGAQVVQNLGNKIKSFGSNAVSAFTEIDAGLDIVTSKTGAMGTALEGMHDIVKNIGGTTGYSFEQIGNAVGEINTQFGLTGETLEKTSLLFLKFSKANTTDVTTSVINAKKAIEAFGLSSENLGNVLDSVTKVAQNTGQSVDTIFSKTVAGAPILKELNLSFQQGANLIGVFEQRGLDSSNMLSKLTKAAAVYGKEGKSLTEGLKETIEKIKNATNSQEQYNEASRVFGTKAAQYMITAIKEGKLSFESLNSTMENVQGTTEETAKRMGESHKGIGAAANAHKLAMSALGEIIAGTITPIFQQLAKVFQKVADFFNKIPAPIKDFVVVLGLVVAAFASLAPSIAVVALALTSLEIALVPVLLIFAGIALAITGIIVIWKNWGSIIDWLGQKWDEFKNYVSRIWTVISETASIVWGTISTTISTVITVISTIISTTLAIISGIWSSIWGTISGVASTVWQTISTTISTLVDGISTTISTVLNTISGVWSTIWATISGITSSIWTGITTTISGALGGISTTFSSIMNGISGTASSIWDGIKGIFSRAIDWIRGLFNFEFRWPHIPLPHFSISGSMNPLRWIDEGVPKISVQWYAKGGILTKPTIFGARDGQLLGGGEAGNEAVLPLNEQTLGAIGRGIAATMNNESIVININNPIVREEADIKLIAQAVYQEIEKGKNRLNKLRGISDDRI